MKILSDVRKVQLRLITRFPLLSSLTVHSGIQRDKEKVRFPLSIVSIFHHLLLIIVDESSGEIFQSFLEFLGGK